MVIARLAPQDYHRWHMPVSGVLASKTPIAGALYTVNPIAINKNVNVYTQNKREVAASLRYEFNENYCFRRFSRSTRIDSAK